MLPAVALGMTMGIATATDLRSGLIPNWLTGLAALAFLALAALGLNQAVSLTTAIVWGCIGGGTLMGLAIVTQGKAIGMGDVKLAAVMGLALGSAVVIALVAAFVLGGVVALVSRQREVRFAPMLAVGTVIGILVAQGQGRT